MRALFLILILSFNFLTIGCATGNYDKYADATVAIEKEDSESYNTKIIALTTIATDPKATEATRASAVMGVAMLTKPKKAALAAPKDPMESTIEFAKIGLQGYLGWLNFFTKGIEATQGPADVDIVNRAFSAGTIQFGNSK